MPTLGLRVAATVLNVMDWVLFVLLGGIVRMLRHRRARKAIRAVEIDKLKVNGPSAPASSVWRHYYSARRGELEERPFMDEDPPIKTVWSFCSRAHRKYQSLPALGSRTLLDIRKLDEGDRFPTKIYGKTVWLTFAQVEAKAKKFGAALRGTLGMTPQTFSESERFEDHPGSHTILLYEETCAEWFIAAQGAHSQSIAVATAYGTLGVESVEQAVNEGNIAVIFCNRASVEKLLAFKRKGSMGTLKHIIYSDLNVVPSEREKRIGSDAGVSVHAFDELIDQAPAMEVTPPHPHHCAVLMYTSGSTGKPKGIVCLHKQLVSLMNALRVHINLREHESLIGYLPLAHIFEMQMEFFAFGYGGTIGYADPKTLTAGAGKCMQQTESGLVMKGALEEFRPTIMGAVPKVWEVIKAGAEAKVLAGGAAKAFLFQTALEAKMAALPIGRITPLWDLLVFGKFKKMLGGRLRLAVSGGGAIQPSVQEWVRTAFGVPLVQGYGLTETCAGLAVQMPDDFRTGVCGSPLPTCDVLLASCPDITDTEGKPYLCDDTEHATSGGVVAVKGRGEVWTRGNNITGGYYKMAAATSEAWTEDGWFKTGDIAAMLPDGSLRIVDRKKNLAKLKGGEYVALEKMNLALKVADVVHKDNGGVCVFADDTLDRPIALVQVIDDKITAIASSLGVSGTVPELCQKPEIKAEVKKQLLETGKKQGLLSSLEQLCAVGLLHEGQAWTPDDGCLTATQKLVPNKIKGKYDAEITAVKKSLSR